ncbi:hypothetical protein OF829_08965 [Sphingomonas sp. LB-2]|uniref:hypothetical protein n=1 Tax=Sphingomonas caeni TaxID=2984949 RepID=UPI00222F12D9|nr:hypothetical protein [Sphingomonas caeni]MCW3847371.1 hypothetical protein [Sphingomonas caeni]
MTHFWMMGAALAGLAMTPPQTLEQCKAKARADQLDYNNRICAHEWSSRVRRACEDRAATVYLHAVDLCVRAATKR